MRVPEAIGIAEGVTPVTMEEVVSRLSAALMKVAQNKGAPGPDGLAVGELCEQWPAAGPELAVACWMGGIAPERSAGRTSRRRVAASAGGGSRT